MSLKAQLEAIIYAAETPITLEQMTQLVKETLVAETDQTAAASEAEMKSRVRSCLEDLIAEYGAPDHGIEIRQVAGGYRMSTKPEQHEVVRAFAKSLKPPIRLSLPALETLAVIAYKQPVTIPEINDIRGVDSGGVIGTLLDRKLITTGGRKQVIGRPILYKTTRELLLRFGLKEIAELPSIEEFEKMAGQMAEQEEIAMESESPETTEERRESDGDVQPLEPVADEVIVDGRLSGLPPKYDDEADDPSAQEAEIQEAEIQESGRS